MHSSLRTKTDDLVFFGKNLAKLFQNYLILPVFFISDIDHKPFNSAPVLVIKCCYTGMPY